MYIYIYGVYTVFLAGTSPNTRSYTVKYMVSPIHMLYGFENWPDPFICCTFGIDYSPIATYLLYTRY